MEFLLSLIVKGKFYKDNIFFLFSLLDRTNTNLGDKKDIFKELHLN